MVKILSIGIGVVALAMAAYFMFVRDDNQSALNDISKRESAVGGVTIIAFGDSLTAGYGLPVSESYPAQLEQALIAKDLNVTVINSGVSGETTKG